MHVFPRHLIEVDSASLSLRLVSSGLVSRGLSLCEREMPLIAGQQIVKRLVEIEEVRPEGQPSNSKNRRRRYTTGRSGKKHKKTTVLHPSSWNKTGRPASTGLSTWWTVLEEATYREGQLPEPVRFISWG